MKGGAGKNLAAFINRLNEDLTLAEPSKRIDVRGKKIILLEESKPPTVLGILDQKVCFTYDSRQFNEHSHLARSIFRQLFLSSYFAMIIQCKITAIPAEVPTNYSEFFIPEEFHYFIIKFCTSGEILEIGLYGQDNTPISFVSSIDRIMQKTRPSRQ